MPNFRKLGFGLVVLASMAPQAAHASGPRMAVAVDGRGHWGYAWTSGVRSPAAAALHYCGHTSCHLEANGAGRCMAFYESRAGGYWYGVGIGNSLRQVERIASHGCSIGAPAGTCRAVKSFCR